MRQYRPKLLSLDVFDTLLWRPFRSPWDLFALIPEKLPPNSSVIKALEPTAVSRMRRKAESEARQRAREGEVNHQEIILRFAEALDTKDRDSLLRAEVLLERKYLQPHAQMFHLIADAEKLGIPYALCSDMYLASDTIASMVKTASERCGVLLPEPLAVLVSCEYQTGKAGDLFDQLIAKTGIAAEDILHIGDNLRADFHGAERKGLKAVHLKKTCERAERILDYEVEYLAAPHSIASDFGLATTRKELMAEHEALNDGALTHRAYGAFIAGPVLVAFANWIVEECILTRQTVVYCLMREGQFLARLINETAEARSVNITARPLWVSRFAIRSANLAEASEKEVIGFLHRIRPVDVQPDLLIKMGVFESQDAQEWHAAAIRDDDVCRKISIITAKLRNDPERLNRVRRVAKQRKEALINYLRNEGLLGVDDATVVDLGWGGTIQASLSRLIQSERPGAKLSALYLATDLRIRELDKENSPWKSFLYVSGEPRATCGILQRTPELLEQFTMCASGSLREFAPDGAPVLFPYEVPEQQVRDVEEIQKGILEFCERWMPRFKLSGGAFATEIEGEVMCDRLRSIIARSLDDPLPEEVRLFKDWLHDSNNGSADLQSVLGSQDVREKVLSGKIRHPMQLDWQKSYWPQGLFNELGVKWRKHKHSQRLVTDLPVRLRTLARGFVHSLPRGLSFQIAHFYHLHLRWLSRWR
jgi:FMN phosphatase YigB (HAD superfamily)